MVYLLAALKIKEDSYLGMPLFLACASLPETTP